MQAPAGKIVTRFAPSPTGFLHVGGARTALYNWMFARKHGGTFLLRIEDTDQGRHVPEAEQAIFDSLRWLGILWDEGPTGSNPGGPGDGGPNGPYRQSERRDIYDTWFRKLLDSGHAYRCYATAEDLDAARKQDDAAKRAFVYRQDRFAHLAVGKTEADAHVVRLRIPDKTLVVHDTILGDVSKTPDVLGDFVIRKANGWPTYHFAVVVDDALMGVTNVIRAQEHLNNTHLHLALQEAMGVPTPVYAHIPIVLNANGSKMSKRNKGAKVEDYRAWGFLPEALVNYMALVGWSPGEDREIMPLDQMVSLFSLDRVNKTNGRWDLKKCMHFNGEYIRAATADTLRGHVNAWLDAHVRKWLPAFQTRMETISEFVQTAAPLWVPEYAYEPEASDKNLTPENLPLLYETAVRLVDTDFSAHATHELLEKTAAEKGIGMGKVAQPVRVALTGKTVSPPVNETLHRLGKDESLRRIARTLARFGGAWGAGAASRLSGRIGRHEDALTHVEQAIKLEPGNDLHPSVRALILMDLARDEDATKAAKDTAKKFEGSPRAALLCAWTLQRAAESISDAKKRGKAYEEVITLAGKAADAPTASDDDRKRGIVLKGFGLFRIGKTEPALKVLAPALAGSTHAAPADAGAWEQLLKDLGPALPAV